MVCPRHGLATGPDGRCALCRTRDRAFVRAGIRSRDPARRAAVFVVALAACVATYAVIASVVDTNHARSDEVRDAGKSAPHDAALR